MLKMKKQNDNRPTGIADLKWFPYLLSAIGAIAFSQFFGFKTSNVFTFIFAVLMFPLFRRRYSQGLKLCRSSCVCGLLLSLFTVASSQFDDEFTNETFVKLETVPAYLAAFFMFFLFYEALTYVLYRKLSGVTFSADRKEPSMKRKASVFFGSMAVMIIIWLPVALYLYPAVVTEDSIWQLQQAAGQTEMTNHHPVLHTMIIRLTYSLGQWLFNGDDTKSVFVYTVTQQLFLSACFAYLVETLYKSKAKKPVVICALLFYVIPVYHAAYSVSMWKDVWFGGIVAVISSLLWRLFTKEKKFRLSVSETVILFVFSLGMCLMRSNGLYAFVLLLIAGAFVFLRRSRLTVAVMAAALAAALIIKGPVYSAMGVKPVDTVESLSIPIQQVAYVAKNPENLTDEQRELLDRVVDVDKIRDKYINWISDNMKDLVREKGNQEYLSEHKSEYLKLWAELGFRYPDKYLRAYITQTYGYWFPDVQNWVITTYCESEGFDIKAVSKAGAFTEFIEFYLAAYIETPFLGLLWSIGMGVWVFIFMMGAAVRRHKRSVLIVYLPVLAIWLTLLIATPVFSEFRYIYSLFTSLPLFCTIPFLKTGTGSEKAEEAEKQADKEADKAEEPEDGQEAAVSQ